jgi:hypothetical protein
VEVESIKAANCRLRVCKMSIFVICDLLLFHKNTWEGSGCETECVWSTSVDLIPGYLYVCSRLAEVESTKAAQSRLRVCKMSIFVISDLLSVHKYTWEGSGCETECAWSTCVDLIPGYLYVCSSLAEVESIKASKSRLCVYEHAFFATFDLLFVHKYTCHGSGCETECVWGTCVDLIPGYLYV